LSWIMLCRFNTLWLSSAFQRWSVICSLETLATVVIYCKLTI
jgi:hypothetical protein